MADKDKDGNLKSTAVELEYGTLTGDFVSGYENRHVRRYLGIPYAKPPIGQLRFADPQEIDRFPEGNLYMALSLCS